MCLVQLHVWLFATLWTAPHQASLSFTPQSLLRLTSIKSVMPTNHFNLCRLFFLLPSIVPRIRVFSNDSAICIRRPKYWSFSFSINPSNEYSGLISPKTDWFDLAVQGTLKSLLQPQFESINSSVLNKLTLLMICFKVFPWLLGILKCNNEV